MPRKLELTFQKGADGRSGRWKKHYRGKTYYLGNGNSKSDHASYRQALAQWETKKKEADDAAAAEARIHDSEYDEAVNSWEQVLRWAVKHGDSICADDARSRLADLRCRREKIPQPPIQFGDRVQSLYEVDPHLVDGLRRAAESIPVANLRADPAWAQSMLRLADGQPLPGLKSVNPNQAGVVTSSEQPIVRSTIPPESNIASPEPLHSEKIKWEDRLEHQTDDDAADADDTTGYWVDKLIARKLRRVQAGELSVGQYRAGETALKAFRDWLGQSTSVHSINARSLSDFHAELLELIRKGAFKANYLRDRMAAAKSFVRWLWENEVIEQLPRNIDSRDLQIARQIGVPEVMQLEEVRELLKHAPTKTQLYILLALNTGMTQKDIADLHPDSVEWSSGALKRKRGKTRRFDSVPTVTYQLWPETLVLLERYRCAGDRLLLNENGAPLYQEYIEEQTGKLKKNDNIKNAYERVKREAKITKSFGKLRKTSATLIESESKYRGLDELFLGHAPSSVAKRHYVATADTALNEALQFLREKYDIESILNESEEAKTASPPPEPETSPA